MNSIDCLMYGNGRTTIDPIEMEYIKNYFKELFFAISGFKDLVHILSSIDHYISKEENFIFPEPYSKEEIHKELIEWALCYKPYSSSRWFFNAQ